MEQPPHACSFLGCILFWGVLGRRLIGNQKCQDIAKVLNCLQRFRREEGCCQWAVLVAQAWSTLARGDGGVGGSMFQEPGVCILSSS